MKSDILVIGAGVCGLTTALALASRGHSIEVLEKRVHVDTEEARRELAKAADLLENANAMHARRDFASVELGEVNAIRRKFWGLKERNVLIDIRTLQLLATLGVELDSLNQLDRMTLESMDGDFVFSIDPLQWRPDQAQLTLDVEELLFRRSYQAQPTLGELERRLLRRLETFANAEVRFGERVIDLDWDGDALKVATSAGAEFHPDYVVIADGAAESSTVNGLPVVRTLMSQEPMTIAVFRALSGSKFLSNDLSRGFTHTLFTEDGWIAAFCDGLNVTIATNACTPGQGPGWELRLIEFLSEFGLDAPLVEPPFQVSGETAIANRFTVTDKIFIAGDAAMSGNPRFGMGVQYCMLWADRIARTFEALESGRAPEISAYERFGQQITARRAEFERAWTGAIDAFARDGWTLMGDDIAAILDQGLERFHFMFQAVDDARVTFDIAFDFRAVLSRRNASALAQTLLNYSRIEFAGEFELENHSVGCDELILKTSLSPKQSLLIRLSSMIWIVDSGSISLLRLAHGWKIEISEAVATICDDPFSKHGQDPRRAHRVKLEPVCIVVPDTLVDQMFGIVGDADMFTTSGDRLVRIDYRLPNGVEQELGALKVLARGQPIVSISAVQNESCSARLIIEVSDGRLAPVAYSEFGGKMELDSLRWIRELSRISNGALDLMLNSWADIAGTTVRRVVVAPAQDKSAILTLYSIAPVTIRIPAADVERLQKLYSSNTIGQLTSAFWTRISGSQI